MLKENISKFTTCYGCGVCVIGCPTKIINLELSKEGFYTPVIENQDKCIECGICLDICAYNHEELASSPEEKNIKAYGCWSKDEKVRRESTTGGMGYELAREALLENTGVCGVKYDISKERAEHTVVHDLEKLAQIQGTKYIPSFTQPGFKDMDRKKEYIVFGLPCQIDSLRRYIRRFKIEDRVRLVDLLCYGVPSLLLWQRYLEHNKNHIIGKIRKVKFRSKMFGWHKSACIEIDSGEKSFIRKAHDSEFYGLFFTNTCLNKCCYDKCKYKLLNSSADIRIGDFWGERYSEDEQGVNVLFAFNERGNSIVESLKQSCGFESVTLEEACQNQKKTNAEKFPLRSFIIWGLRNNYSLRNLYLLSKGTRVLLNPRIVTKWLFSKL